MCGGGINRIIWYVAVNTQFSLQGFGVIVTIRFHNIIALISRSN